MRRAKEKKKTFIQTQVNNNFFYANSIITDWSYRDYAKTRPAHDAPESSSVIIPGLCNKGKKINTIRGVRNKSHNNVTKALNHQRKNEIKPNFLPSDKETLNFTV